MAVQRMGFVDLAQVQALGDDWMSVKGVGRKTVEEIKVACASVQSPSSAEFYWGRTLGWAGLGAIQRMLTDDDKLNWGALRDAEIIYPDRAAA